MTEQVRSSSGGESLTRETAGSLPGINALVGNKRGLTEQNGL